MTLQLNVPQDVETTSVVALHQAPRVGSFRFEHAVDGIDRRLFLNPTFSRPEIVAPLADQISCDIQSF